MQHANSRTRRPASTVVALLTRTMLGAALLALGWATPAAAQDPDIRNIRPAVMLLVDSSGSMERMHGGTEAPLPQCSGSAGGSDERNRWTTVVEALSGSWNDTEYFCTAIDRSAYMGSPDYNYYLPYHQPPLTVDQNSDGVLDVYVERIKFGLMTFDGVYTFTDAHPLLVPRPRFEMRLVDNVTSPGGYSYGEPRELTYPGCETSFLVDSGARNATAPGGALISVGDETADYRLINQSVQNQLREVRPFGSTPTAALLEDFRYYLNNHPDVTTDDPFQECRSRFAILLTDGQPDEDFRDARFNCDAVDGCPYDRAQTIAAELCEASSGGICTGLVDGVFVVAFDVSDAAAVAELDAIADAGGTGSALLATNRDELVRRISDALDRSAPGNTTRSQPAFVQGGSTFSSGGSPVQLEFNAGFRVGDLDTPWRGILERTRYLCDASNQPKAEEVAQRVRFDQELNSQSTRRLLTVVTSEPDDMDGNLVGTQGSGVPLGADQPPGVVTNQTLSSFDASIDPEYFGIADLSTAATERRNRIVEWVHGTAHRTDAKMGDIYHSSPVAVSAPRVDLRDESYNLFRRREDVANRPTVVYVGTNDGILHAFVAEDWTSPDGATSYVAGHELWGFIPPVLMSKLESATLSHQIMVDGTPVIRDVLFRREQGTTPTADLYHTVLVMGFRAGGRGYFALDITNPLEPEFLWQYIGQPTGDVSETPQGESYGLPALGQALVEVGTGLQERAIAVLPGGQGRLDPIRSELTGSGGCANAIVTPDATDGAGEARSHQRCWKRHGRVLTFVDVGTGEVLREFNHSTFNAPLTGGVTLYPGDVGTVAERSFFTDADGVMWTVDFTQRDPANWEARPFHDIFWDAGATEGQPAYNPPLVSVDEAGQVVVIQATGDIDRLDSIAHNRVVSLTEERSFSSSGAASYQTSLNWEIRLREGEQATGPLELFESTVYFASFESASDPSNLCDLGRGRIWGVHYLDAGATPPDGYDDVVGAFPEPRFESTAGTGTFDLHFRGPFEDSLVLGVGVTQRPTCLTGADIPDPYIGTRFQVSNASGGQFELTAQLSGGDSSGDGGAIQTVTEQINAPDSFTRVDGFAGQVDY